MSEATGARRRRARASRCGPISILIDLQLPDFDGFEVLRRLRADPRHARRSRASRLSANAMREDIERGLARGFVDYWTKPIDFAVFLAALNQLFLGRRRPVPTPSRIRR